jgi:hypothetical protein
MDNRAGSLQREPDPADGESAKLVIDTLVIDALVIDTALVEHSVTPAHENRDWRLSIQLRKGREWVRVLVLGLKSSASFLFTRNHSRQPHHFLETVKIVRG